MIAKRLLEKVMKPHNEKHGSTTSKLDVQITMHYGIPYTASVLAFDPIQRLLAIGTLDGRIKVIGGDNIEGLLVSQKKAPYKNVEFLHNQGFLAGVSKDNEIQVWNLESRRLVHSLQWEVNVTAFSVIHGSYFMYVGDENGLLSVLKYEAEDEKISILPYHIPANDLAEAAGISFPEIQSVVGILPQPGSSWTKVLIAYEKGMLVLWDISKDSIVTIRGYAGFKEDEHADSLTVSGNQLHQEEKEICSLCWASSTGSVLAVGYTNGDIFLYDFSSISSTKGPQASIPSKNVAKLQLASGESRLPVIVLHWSCNDRANVDKGGKLFIYGGDELGSEEVLTVLSLEWSSGIETLKCISRVDLKLNGSFADMILIPNSGVPETNSTAALFVLTNPGQLSIYDGAILSMLKSEGERSSIQAEKFQDIVPTNDPHMTVASLCLLSMDKSYSKVLSKKDYSKRTSAPTLSGGAKWPLTGGVPTEAFTEDYAIEKIYIAGYQDGSVRVWDATHPILVLMFVLEGQLPVTELAAPNTPVSALSFCSISMTLAIGNKSGLVRICALRESTNESSFHFVTETNNEVHTVHHGKGFHCIAAFSLSSSVISALQFTNSGDKLAVGFENQVVMLDMTTLSIIFRTDCLSGKSSPIISLSTYVFPENIVQVSQINSLKQLDAPNLKVSTEIVLILTKDSYVTIIDSMTGAIISSKKLHTEKESVAISMHVIEGSVPAPQVAAERCSEDTPDDSSSVKEPESSDNINRSKTQEVDENRSRDALHHPENLIDPHLLLCCADALRLYPLKSVLEGKSNYTCKVNLVKRCCWTTIFKKSENKYGLILLYETGVIEIRSLPGLEITAETSLMHILRWSFKPNMDRTMSSSDNGQIALVGGCEFALISFLDNESRFQENLPSLHDKVLAAAADAAINHTTDQRKRENTSSGLLGGFVRGLAVSTSESLPDTICSSTQQLEEIFSRIPFSHLSDIIIDDTDFGELNIDDIEVDDALPTESTSLTIDKKKRTDYIEIDDVSPTESTSFNRTKNKKTDEEREKLFHGSTQDIKPTVRSTEEIMAKYRGVEYAARARDKLMERQEKLQRLDQKTAELQDHAESFADMATELAKAMEKKKWWKI